RVVPHRAERGVLRRALLADPGRRAGGRPAGGRGLRCGLRHAGARPEPGRGRAAAAPRPRDVLLGARRGADGAAGDLRGPDRGRGGVAAALDRGGRPPPRAALRGRRPARPGGRGRPEASPPPEVTPHPLPSGGRVRGEGPYFPFTRSSSSGPAYGNAGIRLSAASSIRGPLARMKPFSQTGAKSARSCTT